MKKIISFICVAILCLAAITSCSLDSIKDKVVDIKDTVVDKVNELIGGEHEHTFGEWKTTKAPTCTAAGEKTATCTKEGCSETKTEAIAATGHTAGAAATCTTAQVCTVCKAELAAAKGHSFGEYSVTKDPTCAIAGEKTAECANCDATDVQPVDATGEHKYIKGECTVCEGTDEAYPASPITPSPITNVTPVVGGEYNLVLYHGNADYLKNLYFTGNTANKAWYLETSENAADAVAVSIEAVDGVDGAFRIFFMKDDVKTYIEVYEYLNSKGYLAGSLKLTTAPENYYTYNADFGVALYTNAESGNQYYLGTYTNSSGDTYSTISASNFNYMDNTNVNSTQYPLVFAEIPDPLTQLNGDYAGAFYGWDYYYLDIDFAAGTITLVDKNAYTLSGEYTFVYSEETGILATNTVDNTLTFTITADADGIYATFPGSYGDIKTTLRVDLPNIDVEEENVLTFEEANLANGITYEFSVYNDGTYEFVCEGLTIVVYDELGELVAPVDGKYELVYGAYTATITAAAAGEYTLTTEYTAPLGSEDNPYDAELPSTADASTTVNTSYDGNNSVWYNAVATANGIITITADKESAGIGCNGSYSDAGVLSFKVIAGLTYEFFVYSTTYAAEDFVLTISYEESAVTEAEYVASLLYSEFKVDDYTVSFGQDWNTGDYYISLSDESWTTYLMFSYTAQLQADGSIIITPVYLPYNYEMGEDAIGLDYSTITATIADGAWSFDFEAAEKTGFEGTYAFVDAWNNKLDVVVTPFEIKLTYYQPMMQQYITDAFEYAVVDGAIVVYFNDEVADALYISVTVSDGEIATITYNGNEYVEAPDPTGLEGEYTAEFDGVEATVVVNTTTFTISYTHPMLGLTSTTYEYVMVDGAPVVMINGVAADPLMAAINVVDGEIASFVDNGTTFTVVVDSDDDGNDDDSGNDEPAGSAENPYVIDNLPMEIEVDGEHDLCYTYTAENDITLLITYVSGNFVSITGGTWDKDSNNLVYTLVIEAGETVTINPWGSSTGAYSISVSGSSDDDQECSHVWNDGEVTTAATCTTDGVKTFTCTVTGCSETKTEPIAAGHTPGDAATCTTAQVCTVCTEPIVAALGHADEDGNYLCDNNCGTVMAPAAGSTLTVVQAAALGQAIGSGNTTSDKYIVTGIVSGSYSYGTGSCYIKDDNDNSLLVYTINGYVDLVAKPVVGDTVTVEGQIKNYDGTSQIQYVNLKNLVVGHTHNWVDASCTAPKTCSDCSLTEGTVTDHVFVDGVCACGMAEGATVYSYDFVSGVFSTSATTATLNGVEWTFAGTGNGYFGWDNNNGKGFQFGSGSNPYSAMTLTSADFTDVTKITINTSGASSIAGTLTVTVGGVQIGETITLTKTATGYELTSETPLDGPIVLSYSQTSSKAIYIKSIEVVYA